MNYAVFVSRAAQRDLAAITGDDYTRLRQALISLESNPRPSGCKKLKDRNGWRIRVGDYRILYEISDKEQSVLVSRIRHRREVYR